MYFQYIPCFHALIAEMVVLECDRVVCHLPAMWGWRQPERSLSLLRSPAMDTALDPDLLDRAAELIDGAERVVVLTGAGISTDSGIPDFRGPNGLWTKNPEAEKASNIRFYVSDPEVRKKNWALRAEGALWANVEPNLGHHALVALQRRGILHTLITQNVDELHQRAGLDPDFVVEIHGTTRKAACLECEYRDDMEMVLDRVRAGEEDPMCTFCGGLLKSATISFGQNLVFEDLQRAEVAANECDLMLAVGSTLSVFPIANVVPVAASHGAPVIIVNGESTQFDPIAEVVINAGISEVLPVICRSELA
jgi:NAD-dependent deacetylase